MSFRTDRNNNPTAFTTDIAKQAGLTLHVDYEDGENFPTGPLITARLLGDPVAITVKVIDAIGYVTKAGAHRWQYISIPTFLWRQLTYQQKRDVIGFHYLNEGGTEMIHLFPNYGKR